MKIFFIHQVVALIPNHLSLGHTYQHCALEDQVPSIDKPQQVLNCHFLLSIDI